MKVSLRCKITKQNEAEKPKLMNEEVYSIKLLSRNSRKFNYSFEMDFLCRFRNNCTKLKLVSRNFSSMKIETIIAILIV